MSIDMKQPAQVYKITHIPSNKYYIGITWGKNISYERRFETHMKGKGGVYIKKLIDDGSTMDDFTTEIIFEGELGISIEKEMEWSSVWPVGLNGNKGRAIIDSDPESTWKKRDLTLSNRSDEEKIISNKKRSRTLKKTLKKLTKEEMLDRMSNSARNLTDEQKIQRGNAISKGKKGKSTNQYKIMEERYKKMSNKEFYEWCEGRKERYVTRARNLRNK